MRYMGSKRAHFKDYWSVLEKYRQPNQIYVEPFCGGCNSIDKVPGRRIANDIHPNLIAMWKALQKGWQPPESVSELEYQQLKRDVERGRVDELTGFVGFGVAYGGMWFDTYAKNDADNDYCQQSRNSVLEQIAKMPVGEVYFTQGSYDKMFIPPNSFIFCDPPYQETAGYQVGDFDHRKFWKWCNQKIAEGHTVFVAEYNAPPDWVPIWEKKVARGTVKKQSEGYAHVKHLSVERVFTRAQTWDEEAAKEYYDPPVHKFYTVKQVLHFVSRGVTEEYAHVEIKDKRATASNPFFTISAPIDIDKNVKPDAKGLLNAVKAADEIKAPVATELTKAGRLAVRAGNFKAFIDCLDDSILVQSFMPKGMYVPNPGEIYRGIRKLAHCMSTDELRPHLMGLMIGKTSVLAVSNVLAAEYWHGCNMPIDVIISADTVKQIVAINEEPTLIQVNENTITFWYYGERFFTSTLIDANWPLDIIMRMFNRPCQPQNLPSDFFDSLQLVKKFANDPPIIRIEPNGMFTSDNEDEGGSIEVATGVPKTVLFMIPILARLEKIATRIDWNQFPEACTFYGDKIRGVIMGRTK